MSEKLKIYVHIYSKDGILPFPLSIVFPIFSDDVDFKVSHSTHENLEFFNKKSPPVDIFFIRFFEGLSDERIKELSSKIKSKFPKAYIVALSSVQSLLMKARMLGIRFTLREMDELSIEIVLKKIVVEIKTGKRKTYGFLGSKRSRNPSWWGAYWFYVVLPIMVIFLIVLVFEIKGIIPPFLTRYMPFLKG